MTSSLFFIQFLSSPLNLPPKRDNNGHEMFVSGFINGVEETQTCLKYTCVLTSPLRNSNAEEYRIQMLRSLASDRQGTCCPWQFGPNYIGPDEDELCRSYSLARDIMVTCAMSILSATGRAVQAAIRISLVNQVFRGINVSTELVYIPLT